MTIYQIFYPDILLVMKSFYPKGVHFETGLYKITAPGNPMFRLEKIGFNIQFFILLNCMNKIPFCP